jgi:hypothetical protein
MVLPHLSMRLHLEGLALKTQSALVYKHSFLFD